MKRNETFRILLALAWLTACGEGENDAPDAGGKEAGAELCLPEASTACVCTDGSPGAQECASDGMGYAPCKCDGEGDGGPNPDDGATADAGCEDGDEASCDCSHLGVSGVVRVCEDGAFGACDCEAAPGAPTLSRTSGGYGAGETFDCIDVTGEPFTEVRYNVSHLHMPPPPSEGDSAGSRICGIDEDGETFIRARLIKDGVLGPAVEGHYLQRSTLPQIASLSHDLVGTGYPGMTFQITAEGDPGLEITVDIGTRNVDLLDPDDDGTYSAEVEVQVGDLADPLGLIADGTDAVGQHAYASALEAIRLDGVGTEISGAQAGDITWTPEGSPYVIQADAAISAAGSLTIQPGTVVAFMAGDLLRVDGELSAVGEACDVIRFVGEGKLWINSVAGTLTYDVTDDSYVHGPRIEHLWAPELTLIAGELYVRRATLHTFAVPRDGWDPRVGNLGDFVHSYLGQSRVQRIGCVGAGGSYWGDDCFLSLQDSRILDVDAGFAQLSNAYLGVIDDPEWGIRHGYFERLRFGEAGNAIVEQNTIDHLIVVHGGVTNNVLGVDGSDALRVTFDDNPLDPGTQLDFSGNYWPGINATLQSAAAGYDAPEIEDYWDDINLPEVLFDPPLASAPADAAPRGSVGGEPECP